MGKSFYLKLAANNLIRNQKKTIPYFIAATIMVSVYFMVLTIIYSPGLADIPSSGYLKELFRIGFFVLNIFITVFLLYINSFLIKQRKKEMGLYGILGLEKRHVGYVMLWENLFLNGAAVVLGIIAGCVFGWLMFMLLMISIHVTQNTYFVLPPKAFIITVAYFILMFLVVSFLNIFKVRTANPIDLLKSDHQGEKKARFLVPMTVLGLIALGYAYYIAINVVNPLQALNKFFFAVILVIFSSYALFTSGSIMLLKLLKKKKKFYYKPDNFVSVAGMFHRMRQNASGLASICILSTMVLVTVSTCIALFIGAEDTLKIRNKDDIMFYREGVISEAQLGQTRQLFEKAAEDNDVLIEAEYSYYSCGGIFQFKDAGFSKPVNKINYLERNALDAVQLSFITLSDFNRICNSDETLKDNQLLLLANEGDYNGVNEFITGDGADRRVYDIVSRRSDTVFTNGKNRKAKNEAYLVLKDRDALMQLTQGLGSSVIATDGTWIILNIKGSQEACCSFSNQINDNETTSPFSLDNIYLNRADGYFIFGGLLFMGAFFTVLFLCSTVLIIYFKQISEGYEDKDRFEMLQKVGMDYREVKRTINKQILIVFFLPLLGALLHLFMASNMIIKLLEVFSLFNHKLTALCMASSCAVFTLVYIIVYRLTARIYCKIVKW